MLIPIMEMTHHWCSSCPVSLWLNVFVEVVNVGIGIAMLLDALPQLLGEEEWAVFLVQLKLVQQGMPVIAITIQSCPYLLLLGSFQCPND